ncbi:DUF402 domain-containing protein [Effusibacillus lacus]|uniref:DUF402 domain-containing protein n=1 Tax=Effusibacillus lacus TaxID=1348429 RepID=A0A292YRC5_9BACL|nr:DUF402 domain-containing protein [Effusibacillus lacus]TCS76986.1 hypothetical protein EDD64_101210 [Effusibacillus lacus]GAX91313.1 hypothetical protein EFBL_2979 [Effusibacillus lacus]
MRKVTIISTKHNEARHRVWESAWVKAENPLLLLIPAHTPVYNPDGSVWSSPYGVEAHFSPAHWFNAFVLKKEEGTEWYCNVASPAQYDAEAGIVRFVDYDLDVYVYADGTHKVLDREEFEENSRVMGYPQEVRERVEQGLQELLRAIHERRGPFKDSNQRTRL